jgi:hypothetical protein
VAVLWLVVSIATGAPARAQGSTATLVGTVTDASRLPLPGASLQVTNEATGAIRTQHAESDGGFIVTHLPPGLHRITIEATGFRRLEVAALVLEADQVRRLDARLEVGPISELVTVSATPLALNSETPSTATVVPERLVQALPLRGRDYLDLVHLVPGIYRRAGEPEDERVATNGTRSDTAAFALDGILNRSDRNGNTGVAVPLDAVRELDVRTSTYAAELGRHAGAQINVVTQAGTNHYGGTLYDYWRSDRFDAPNPFARLDEPSTLSRQQGGGSLGGPIRRNRTFFFAAFELMRERRSRAANNTAPSADWLAGDFRNVRDAGRDGVWGNADDTNRIVNPFTGLEFATPNVVPDALIDPTARQILAFIPAANLLGTLDGYTAQGLARESNQQLLARIDHQWTGSTALAGRWARAWGTGVDPFPADRVFYPGFEQRLEARGDSAVFSATTLLGDGVVHDARLGFYRQHEGRLGGQSDTNYVGQLGLPDLSQDPAVWGFPTIRIDGFPDIGDRPNAPQDHTATNLQLLDTLTWTAGRHTVKAGLDVVRSTYDEQDLRSIRGDFRFRGRGTNPTNRTSSGVYSFADFLVGVIDQSQRQLGIEPARLTGWQTAFFVQDDWRVRPALTLSLGLRYEYQAPLAERNGRLANFVPDLGEVVLSGDPRLPASLLRSVGTGFSPRIGFAWRPFGDVRTVVRGGTGVYHSLEAFNVTRQQLAVSYPFVQREQFRRSNNPASLSFANPFPAARGTTQGVDTPLGMAVDYRTPIVHQYNLTVERELGSDLALTLGYVGSQGRHLGRRYNLNQPIPTGLLPNGALATVVPFPAFGDIQYQDQIVSSSYDALQVTLRRRGTDGLSMLLSYALGTSIDQGSRSTGNLSNVSTNGAQKAPQNIYDMEAERGPSDFDRRHQLSAAFAYELPFGVGRRWLAGTGSVLPALVGNWELAGLVTLQSGRPYTPQYESGDFATQRPDVVGDPTTGIPDGLWFNPDAFARPVATATAPDRYGNAGRNILRGPDYRTVDLAAIKSIAVGDGVRLQLRLEAFNVLNRRNYQVPVFLLDRSDVGRVTATESDARQLQIAARLEF